MAAVLWLICAVVLAVAETAVGEFTLLMLGGGALVTAGASAVVDMPLWLQGIVFAVSSVLLLAAVRPPLRRYIERRRGDAPSYLESLPGMKVAVVQPVSSVDGRVLIGGEEWSARTPYDGEPIAVGTEVTIVEIDGAVAVVVES